MYHTSCERILKRIKVPNRTITPSTNEGFVIFGHSSKQEGSIDVQISRVFSFFSFMYTFIQPFKCAHIKYKNMILKCIFILWIHLNFNTFCTSCQSEINEIIQHFLISSESGDDIVNDRRR